MLREESPHLLSHPLRLHRTRHRPRDRRTTSRVTVSRDVSWPKEAMRPTSACSTTDIPIALPTKWRINFSMRFANCWVGILPLPEMTSTPQEKYVLSQLATTHFDWRISLVSIPNPLRSATFGSLSRFHSGLADPLGSLTYPTDASTLLRSSEGTRTNEAGLWKEFAWRDGPFADSPCAVRGRQAIRVPAPRQARRSGSPVRRLLVPFGSACQSCCL